ncbi:Alpha-N-acetylgalactosaminide alpha-2,6-sialyltransferase 2 [Chelonia mydas]|uniref:alpha-N-acetylgalactosaminide alpha-2,6-sialyltransferase n=1 Tax=Chelonia mydas TaxID=8469 RepID=M7CEQ1_CHEMY|nr:Alpha-N-acetylgalactosaminide alpha-2,6-sialyltransferase 2 [Chelonia mydas]
MANFALDTTQSYYKDEHRGAGCSPEIQSVTYAHTVHSVWPRSFGTIPTPQTDHGGGRGCEMDGKLPWGHEAMIHCALRWALLGAVTLEFLYQARTYYSQGSFPSFFYRDPVGARQPRAGPMTVQTPVTPLGSRAPTSTLQLFLGDLYGQDKTYQGSRCPSGIRKRIAGTKFSSIFLEAIPVLQWAQHAWLAEYRRLQSYGGAHGWQDVSWPGPTRPSPRASKETTNAALTKGFERDVGRRTSFYIFSTNTMMNSLHNYASNGFRQLPQTPETKYIFLPDHDRDYLLLQAALTNRPVNSGPDEGARPERYFGKDLRAEKFKMFHPDFIRYVRNRFLRSSILDTPLRRLYRPSTGAVMLLAGPPTR